MTIFGIDVSAYQGKPNWSAIQESGIGFAFAKATQGTGYTSSSWAYDQDHTLALQDFAPGAYHFLSATDDPAEQARYFVGRLKNPGSMMIALDIERYKDSAGVTRKPTAGQGRAWAEEFRRLVPGHPLLGYIPKWYWDELGKPDLSFFDALWASSYVSGSGTPADLFSKTFSRQWASYGGRDVGILQFGASGHVTGVEGPVDVDAYMGTLNGLRALTLPLTILQPVPEIGPPIPVPALKVDGELGKKTITTLQVVTAWWLHVTIPLDGVLSKSFIRFLQFHLSVNADGVLGEITIRALQKKVGSTQDGEWGPATTRDLQRALNAGRF